MTELAWMQRWYQQHCDGVWEHAHGIKIETLDNPGWEVEIEVRDTPYQKCAMDEMRIDASDTDWIHCQVSDGCFRGFGDPSKLEIILRQFRHWIEGCSEGLGPTNTTEPINSPKLGQ